MLARIALGVSIVLMACEGRFLPQQAKEGRELQLSEEEMQRRAALITPVDFVCDPTSAWSSTPLRRLSHSQYERALQAVVTALAPQRSTAVLAAAQSALAAFPADVRTAVTAEKHGGFRRLDQALRFEHVEVGLEVAQAVADALSPGEQEAEQLLGGCASNAVTDDDVACVRDFIARAGLLAERRPLQSEDIDFYLSVYADSGISPAGVRDVLAALLSSPYFFYQVEHGGPDIGGDGVAALSGHELASRLSLHFWDAPPDATLLGMAASLTTDSGYAQALSYVLNDSRIEVMLRQLFSEWLSLEDLPELDRFNGAPLYDAVTAGFAPNADTREHMIDDVVGLGVYLTGRTDGRFDDLFTSRKIFPTSDDLAQIYGVPRWSGQGEPPEGDDDRAGILTRPALVASGLPATRPIMKGVFIRTTLLCDQLSPPPANAQAVAKEEEATLPALLSTRQRIEALTEKSGTSCSGCHSLSINGLGFLSEGFDALGRSRSAERVFDAAGTLLGEVPIDTSATPRIVTSDETQVTGIGQATNAMLESQKPQACFVRKYLRFAFSRGEDVVNDGCALKTLRDAAVEHAPLKDVFAAVAHTPMFKQRRF